ncbi:hypothetical protein, partial [Faecalibaculum rodentium]
IEHIKIYCIERELGVLTCTKRTFLTVKCTRFSSFFRGMLPFLLPKALDGGPFLVFFRPNVASKEGRIES